MPAYSASAPGKIILFGEHAVVYGRPAIAAPVAQVKAKAILTADPRAEPGSVQVQAPDVRLDSVLSSLPLDDAIAKAISGTFAALGVSKPPAFKLRISSTIPLAAGLGSGAAVSVAIIRAVSAFLGRPLPDEEVSALTYDVEKIHHGTPSGIDNTVVTYAMPVYFIRERPIQTFQVKKPFTIVIGDTGIASSTAVAVGDLRELWQADKAQYEAIFDEVSAIAQKARQAIEDGQPESLGALMDENHAWLQKMTVSSPELDQLVGAAREAGALGAKMSGAGRGGNMIALVLPDMAQTVAEALMSAGATNTITTTVGGQGSLGARERGSTDVRGIG